MKPSMREIARATAAYFSLSLEDLIAQNRAQKFSWPRQIAMALCRDMSGRSTPDIGRFFGGRDHTTVLHACDAVSAEVGKDDESVRAMMAIAAQASGMSIDRQARELDWAQDLHCGQPMVLLLPPEPIPGLPVISSAASRRVMVPVRSLPARQHARPQLLPSDLRPPSLAHMMGARA